MQKRSILVLAVLLLASFAVPAMAEVSLNGFYRAKGHVSNFENYTAGNFVANDNTRTNTYVEQRARLKFSAGEENIKAVAFFEIDSRWGDSSTSNGARNAGAAIQGDSINLETKNVYLWFKVPETSVDFTVGLQNVTDPYAGVFMGGADVAGIFTNFKLEPVAVRLGWARPYQRDSANGTGATRISGSTDLLVAEAKVLPTKNAKIGVNFYFLRDAGEIQNPPAAPTQTGNSANAFAFGPGVTKLYMPGVDFAVAASDVVTLNGFVFAQYGDRQFDDPARAKEKFRGYAADLRADAALGKAKAFVEGLYLTGDKASSGDKVEGVFVMDDLKVQSGSSGYSRSDMYILLPNADSLNTSDALTYSANNNRVSSGEGSNGTRVGVVHFAAGASMEVAPKTTAKVGVGYLAAARKNANAGFNFASSRSMGTEANLAVNYNIAKGLDFGVVGAYCWLGGAYDKNASGASQDPDNLYTTVARINYAF